MAEADVAAELAALATECEETAARSKRRGRKYYFFGYGLMVVSVLGSIGAGILALWIEAPSKWVGTVALLPALCATVASQLRLVEKGNWFYHRHREMHALGRRVAVARLRAPTIETLAACAEEHADLDRRMGEAWTENLSFSFTSPGRAELS